MEMTQEELNEKLRLHKLWFKDEEGGVQLDLSSQNLSYADLRGRICDWRI